MQPPEQLHPLPSGANNSASALSTITSNYARAHRNSSKLMALQEWVRAMMGVK